MDRDIVEIIIDVIWLAVLIVCLNIKYFGTHEITTGEFYICIILWYGIGRYLLMTHNK